MKVEESDGRTERKNYSPYLVTGCLLWIVNRQSSIVNTLRLSILLCY